jgi:patatin-related protein
VSETVFNPQQEIRFAVVMFGGVSLCIYIHGVAQELMRMVRATSGANIGDDEVQHIYRDLATNVRGITQSDKRVPTRFLIDLLSGTSAGGINAVFLAKALAMRAQNLDSLRNTWLDKSDMGKLLNTGGNPFEAKRSLLKGDWMYEELLNAFRDMTKSPCDKKDGYQQADLIDLFVTATDLNGARIPIHLSDQDVNERVHKASFHFQLDSLDVGELPPSQDVPEQPERKKCPIAAPALPSRDDFQGAFDPLLAFVSRCTSSFPVAFPPMKLENIESVVGKTDYTKMKEAFQPFFRWVAPHPTQEGARLEFDERELADGGYLDNKPFGYVINALTYRPSSVVQSRKLFYIDPFPEGVNVQPEVAHFDFVSNALAAAMTLPRYETIREDIERIKQSNRLQERLITLKDTVCGAWGQTPREFEGLGLKQMIAIHGPGYGTYHVIRVAQVTDDLARTIAHVSGSNEDEDLFLAIRYLVRYWREQHFEHDPTGTTKSENEFLTRFDFSFRMRRLIDLLDWSQKNGASEELRLRLRRQLARLHRTRARLESPLRPDNPLLPTFKKIGDKLSWDKVKTIMRPPVEKDRQERAVQIYKEGDPASFQALVDVIGETWETVFCHNRIELKELRDGLPDLEKFYQSFDFRDMLSLSVLEGSDVSEHTLTEIYRISPADGVQRAPGKKKLAGTALMDFGSFLKREWRENDILWGRLDASERIVAAVLPCKDAKDEELRAVYFKRLRSAILEQEISMRTASDPCRDPALAAVKDGPDAVKRFLEVVYEVPPGPTAEQSVKWMGEASTILGSMFKDDRGIENRFTKSLKILGTVFTAVAGFLVPHSIWNILFRYWLSLVFFFCVTILGLGLLFNKPEMKSVGLEGGAVVIAVWLAVVWRAAAFDKRWQRFLGWLIVLPVALVFWLGIHRLPSCWHWITALMTRVFGSLFR